MSNIFRVYLEREGEQKTYITFGMPPPTLGERDRNGWLISKVEVPPEVGVINRQMLRTMYEW